jgi:hypothetical protein
MRTAVGIIVIWLSTAVRGSCQSSSSPPNAPADVQTVPQHSQSAAAQAQMLHAAVSAALTQAKTQEADFGFRSFEEARGATAASPIPVVRVFIAELSEYKPRTSVGGMLHATGEYLLPFVATDSTRLTVLLPGASDYRPQVWDTSLASHLNQTPSSFRTARQKILIKIPELGVQLFGYYKQTNGRSELFVVPASEIAATELSGRNEISAAAAFAMLAPIAEELQRTPSDEHSPPGA